jgi:SAM-dependent methyltransferase
LTPDDLQTEAATERQRISAIAHTSSPMWGPIADRTVDELTALVGRHGIDTSSRVLDLGCGPAELLRRICEWTRATGTGVDASPLALAEARRRLTGSPAENRIDLRLADVTALEGLVEHDLVICVGPGWKSGGWGDLTGWAARFVAPGGLLLLGEGAWRLAPPSHALARLGMRADDYLPAPDVPSAVTEAGASVLWSRRATTQEWAAYADAYRSSMRDFARDHPDDPVTPPLLERAEAGWADYELLHELLDFVLVLATAA